MLVSKNNLFALHYISSKRNARSTVQTEQAMTRKGCGAGPLKGGSMMRSKRVMRDSSMFRIRAFLRALTDRPYNEVP